MDKFLFLLSGSKWYDNLTNETDIPTNPVSTDVMPLLYTILTVAGVIVLILGSFMLITAMADGHSQGKIRAISILGLGLLMVSIESFATTLQKIDSGFKIIDTATNPNTINANNLEMLIDMVTTPLFYMGLILCFIAGLQLALAMATERIEEKIDSGKLIAIGLLLVTMSSLATGIAGIIISTNASSDNRAGQLLYLIVDMVVLPIAKIIGILLIPYGGIKVGLAMKEEDASALTNSIKILLVGAILFILSLSLGAVIPSGNIGPQQAPQTQQEAEDYVHNSVALSPPSGRQG